MEKMINLDALADAACDRIEDIVFGCNSNPIKSKIAKLLSENTELGNSKKISKQLKSEEIEHEMEVGIIDFENNLMIYKIELYLDCEPYATIEGFIDGEDWFIDGGNEDIECDGFQDAFIESLDLCDLY